MLIELSAWSCGDQNAGQNVTINRVLSLWERLVYLGTAVTNHDYIQEQIKSRLQSGNACYNWVQNILSSSLLSKNLKIKIFKTIILRSVLYGCETWSLAWREERRLKVF